MSVPLKIIILEDREQDALLLASTLREQGLEFTWMQVDTEEDFRKALKGSVDVILADYQLEEFTAKDALEWLRQSGKDIPVLIVTGALGDEAAAAVMREGAVDYLLKDRPARLRSAIEYALAQKRHREARRAAEKALQLSERRFRRVFESSPAGLAILDSATRIVEANRAFSTMCGVHVSSLCGMYFQDVLAPEHHPAFARVWEQLASGHETTEPITVVCSLAQPAPTYAALRLSRLEGWEKSDEAALVVCDDITDEVRANEVKARKAALAHAIAIAADVFLSTDDWRTALDSFVQRLGVAAQAEAVCVFRYDIAGELVADTTWSRTETDVSSEVSDFVRQLLKTETGGPLRAPRVLTTTMPCIREASNFRIIVAPVAVRRGLWGYVGIVRSMEDEDWQAEELSSYQAAADLLGNAIEDREASARLRASEQRLRLLVDTALDAVITVDGDGFITSWNPRAVEMFGYSEDDVRGTPLLSVIAPPHAHQEWRKAGVRPPRDANTGPMAGRFETLAIRREGTEFPVEVGFAMVADPENPVLNLYVRDISRQKQAEQELKEAEEQDIRVAERIQDKLLIGAPLAVSEVFRIAVGARPGRSVSGDFVWTVQHHRDMLDVLVADVMGKGLSAALLGAVTKSYLYESTRLLTAHLEPFGRPPTPREVLMALQERLSSELRAMESYVTLSYLRIDRARKVATVVGCGHPPVLHINPRQRTCRALKSENLPLGVLDHELLTATEHPFEHGDVFFLYTDGIVEAENAEQAFYGEDRLRIVLLDTASTRDMDLIVQRVIEDVLDFVGSAPRTDDLTCVAVTTEEPVLQTPQLRRTLEVPGSFENLESVRLFVTALCQDLPGPPIEEAILHRFVQAVHEAVCNVIQHAHAHRADMSVQIIGEGYEDRVELRIYDVGAGINVQGLQAHDLGGDKPLTGKDFIEAGVHEWQYVSRQLGRNYLRLVLRRNEPLPPLA